MVLDPSSSSSFLTANSNLLAFLSANGATYSPSIAIHDYSSQYADRGIIATSDLNPNHTLLSIPLSLCLSHLTSRAAPWISKHPALFKHGWAPAILALMYELANMDTSFWKPYFDVLPSELNTPIFWCDEDLQYLKGTDVLGQMQLEESTTLYENIILPVIKASVADHERYSLACFMRAGSILMAYGFENVIDGHDGMPVLVPLADTFNASHPSTVRLEKESGKKLLVMCTTASIPAHAQIFNTYGDLGSNELLRRYGYLEWKNAFDSVSIGGGELVLPRIKEVVVNTWGKDMDAEKVDSILDKRVRGLSEIQIFEDEFLISDLRPVPADLILTIKLLLLPPNKYKSKLMKPASIFPNVRKYLTARETDPIPGAPIHLSAQESQILFHVISDRIAMYPEPNAQQQKCAQILAQSSGLSEYVAGVESGVDKGSVRIAYAYYVRDSELQLLTAVVDRLKNAERVDGLKSPGASNQEQAQILIFEDY